jgi:hypothetical protein
VIRERVLEQQKKEDDRVAEAKFRAEDKKLYTSKEKNWKEHQVEEVDKRRTNRERTEKQEREGGQKVRTALPVYLPVVGPSKPTIGPAKDVRLVVVKSKIVIPSEKSEEHGREAHGPDLSEPLNIHPEETELLREGNENAPKSYDHSSSRRNRSRNSSPDNRRGRSPQRRRH